MNEGQAMPFNAQLEIQELKMQVKQLHADLESLTAGTKAMRDVVESTDNLTMWLMECVVDLAKGTIHEPKFRAQIRQITAQQLAATVKTMQGLRPHVGEGMGKLFDSLVKTDILGDEGLMKSLVAAGLPKEIIEALAEGEAAIVTMDADARATLGCDCIWCETVRKQKGSHDEISQPSDAPHTKH